MTKWILLRKIKREKREGEGKIERNKRLESFNVSRVSRLRKLLLGFEVKNRVSSTDLLKKKKTISCVQFDIIIANIPNLATIAD